MAYTILIAEDNPIIREHIIETLDEMGYQTFSAEDSKSCLLQIKNKIPHILILDIMMDEVSGIETLRKIKKTKITKKIYIIVNTIITKNSREGQIIATFADAYIEKPAKIEVLLSEVARAVEHIKSQP